MQAQATGQAWSGALAVGDLVVGLGHGCVKWWYVPGPVRQEPGLRSLLPGSHLHVTCIL